MQKYGDNIQQNKDHNHNCYVFSHSCYILYLLILFLVIFFPKLNPIVLYFYFSFRTSYLFFAFVHSNIILYWYVLYLLFYCHLTQIKYEHFVSSILHFNLSENKIFFRKS